MGRTVADPPRPPAEAGRPRAPFLDVPLSAPPRPGAGRPCACRRPAGPGPCPVHARHPQAALMELPLAVVGEVLARLDLRWWTALRGCSREARAAVDDAAGAAGLRAVARGGARLGSPAFWRDAARTRGGWRVGIREYARHHGVGVDALLALGLDDPDLLRARRARGDPAAGAAALARVSLPPAPDGARAAVRVRAPRCLGFLVADAPRGAGRGWVDEAFRDACRCNFPAGAAALLAAAAAAAPPGGGPGAAGGGGLLRAADALGGTALHEAAREGHADVVRWLAAAGADLEARTRGGRTPLAEAVVYGRLDAARALLEAGADAAAAAAPGDGAGRGALRRCRERHPELDALLRSRGGVGDGG